MDEGRQRFHRLARLGPHAEVGVGFAEGDHPVLPHDEDGGQRQPPARLGRGLVSAAGVDKRNVHQNSLVVAAMLLRHGVGNAKSLGQRCARVRKDGEPEVLWQFKGRARRICGLPRSTPSSVDRSPGAPAFRIRQRRERMRHPKFCGNSKDRPPAR